MRPTVAEIDLDALTHNISRIREKIGSEVKLLAVVKAEAYGHGASVVSRWAEPLVDYFGVATVSEGVFLRRQGIKKPVVVLGGFHRGEEELLLKEGLEPAVFSSWQLRELSALGKRSGRTIRVHLKIDTGLGRLGFSWEDLLRSPRLLDHPALEFASAFTTLASAGSDAHPSVELQRERFDQVIDALPYEFSLLHIANSAALLLDRRNHYSMVRPGIALYGISPFGGGFEEFRPVMRYRSEIMFLKEVPPGTPLGYNGTFMTKRRSLIATVPAGYEDGVARCLSNRGYMLVKGKRAPVVGVVSMDLTLLDVTDVEGVREGDEVVIFHGSENLWELSRLCGTIPYELLCRVGRRVERVYYQGGEEVERVKL